MSPELIREFHREILRGMRQGTVHFPALITEAEPRKRTLRNPDFICVDCGLVFQRLEAAQKRCNTCAIAEDHARKTRWNKQRKSRAKAPAAAPR